VGRRGPSPSPPRGDSDGLLARRLSSLPNPLSSITGLRLALSSITGLCLSLSPMGQPSPLVQSPSPPAFASSARASTRGSSGSASVLLPPDEAAIANVRGCTGGGLFLHCICPPSLSSITGLRLPPSSIISQRLVGSKVIQSSDTLGRISFMLQKLRFRASSLELSPLFKIVGCWKQTSS
jgi:hypothetical protein